MKLCYQGGKEKSGRYEGETTLVVPVGVQLHNRKGKSVKIENFWRKKSS